MNNSYYTLITGGSEGFGKNLAIECARRKMNLILVALPGPELHALAGLIKRNYCVDVVSIEKDLCEEGSCVELFNEVKALKLQVNILINNAGIGSTVMFGEGSIGLFERQIKLNVLATTLITRLFLDTLKKNAPSFILNIGSLASYFSLPKKQVYGATKSFVYFFSKSLCKELKPDNIHVSVLCPGGMNTNLPITLMNMSGNFISRLSIMNPEHVVPLAINRMLRKKEVIIPGWINHFFLVLDKILPGFVKIYICKKFMKKLNPDNRLVNNPQSLIPVQPSSKVA